MRPWLGEHVLVETNERLRDTSADSGIVIGTTNLSEMNINIVKKKKKRTRDIKNTNAYRHASFCESLSECSDDVLRCKVCALLAAMAVKDGDQVLSRAISKLSAGGIRHKRSTRFTSSSSEMYPCTRVTSSMVLRRPIVSANPILNRFDSRSGVRRCPSRSSWIDCPGSADGTRTALERVRPCGRSSSASTGGGPAAAAEEEM